MTQNFDISQAKYRVILYNYDILIHSYNKSQLDALTSQIYFWNKTLHVSDSSSVHHHEFFTVHTAMVYVIQVCWRIPLLCVR